MAAGPRAEHDVDDVRQRHVAVMRPLVIAPAKVHAHLLGRNVGDRVVEGLDVQLRLLAELGELEVGMLDMPAHRKVGAVDLQDEAGLAIVLYSCRIASAIANR